ncbi:MAG: hypothetical protein OEZ06_10800 [Myxococcales bacterium]|nr:hypothetical protein [Myxococcales bacterium]
MKAAIITFSLCLGLAATGSAQGKPGAKRANSGAKSHAPLSEIRSIVHELERHTGKLRDLMTQYRSLAGQRPPAQGGSPEAKKAHDKQLNKWERALDRLLTRVEKAQAGVTEQIARLDAATGGELPTALGKDVANARNSAEDERVAAANALAKRKPLPKRAKDSKQTQAAAKDEEPPLADLDDF